MKVMKQEQAIAGAMPLFDEGQAIVLFYKYFSSSSTSSSSRAIERWWKDPQKNVRKLYMWHENNLSSSSSSSSSSSEKMSSPPTGRIKQRLPLVGRILISTEGINGTLSGNRKDVETYIELMKDYDDLSMNNTTTPDDDDDDCDEEKISDTNNSNVNIGSSSIHDDTGNDIDNDDDANSSSMIFQDVDWKLSYDDSSSGQLFPDLKISIVKEIVSTSGLVNVNDIPLETGKHLTPEEFHEILELSSLSLSLSSSPSSSIQSQSQQQQAKEVVLIDVRNTFEHDIGHFVNPKTNIKALDPETTTFSSFEKFCEQNANELRDKKVLMYCTGGIRCEKASVLLKRKGVEDVNQLSGGIHRYLEIYGNDGHFKGLNFTFDKRVAMKPNFATKAITKNDDDDNDNEENDNVIVGHKNVVTINNNDDDSDHDDDDDDDDSYEVVGRCVECSDPFDELCGSRVCTVCRDLVLVCEKCRTRSNTLREFHCKRHAVWKTCYFSFLEIFDQSELEEQHRVLLSLRDEASVERGNNKNVRRTLTRQINKVESRMREIKEDCLLIDRNAPRRCRSCQEQLGTVCDGKCWGFWKKVEVTSNDDDNSSKVEKVKMRGRRAKQKHEAEMEFLPKPTPNTITISQ
ncbi:MAG: putative sulfurtransferase [Bacillariaceae sp.]|jgi:predicted sulfurtransferase